MLFPRVDVVFFLPLFPCATFFPRAMCRSPTASVRPVALAAIFFPGFALGRVVCRPLVGFSQHFPFLRSPLPLFRSRVFCRNVIVATWKPRDRECTTSQKVFFLPSNPADTIVLCFNLIDVILHLPPASLPAAGRFSLQAVAYLSALF